MKQPWQIWLLYTLGLIAVVGAFAWLTMRALELDRAESLARRQAELEEDVTATLWRMDSILTPLLAEEAARPSDDFRAVWPGNAPTAARELSPLLTHRPEFVLLHFELAADGQMSSPQCPTGTDRELAIQQGVNATEIDSAAARLAELRPALAFSTLSAQCAPAAPQDAAVAVPGVNQQAPVTNQQALFNPYEESVQQQLKNLNSAVPQQSDFPVGVQ